jgi:3-hydroxypropanoate dehydrogenase
VSVDARTEFDLNDELAVDSAAASALFLDARTANTFSTEPVSDEKLRAIYELTKMGPTMMNNQPLRITWVRSEEARGRLAAQMAEGNREKTRTAPAVALLSYDADWHEHFGTFFPHAPERKAYFEEPAGREAIARNNAWLQSGYFVMAVRAVGLHAGPMGGFDAAGIDAEFNAGTAQKVFMVVNVGTPGDNPWFDRLPRLAAETATATV